MIKTIINHGCWMLMLAASLICMPTSNSNAGDVFSQTGLKCSCPVCDHTCQLKAEQVEEEKTCFKVESKVICIPRVVFPWQKSKQAACASCDSCDGLGCTNCVHNGARLRKICVLKKEKYTCPACKYSWTPVEKDSCCDSTCAAIPVEMIESHNQPTIATPPAIQEAAPASSAVTPDVTEPISAADYYRIPAPIVAGRPVTPIR
ncbi:hypothetical protein LOC67_04745 [Stieleria sp. JC731]|uniref:hypothetical protein n=1 Tax=Pirellulaceae TaxID=2691357 RepID=UPI001E4823A8|nr:hypothetical protein [Stieleria sp. JC731]MCC9599862.1 hypothetical protein [Stieleria sp. JC731]